MARCKMWRWGGRGVVVTKLWLDIKRGSTSLTIWREAGAVLTNHNNGYSDRLSGGWEEVGERSSNLVGLKGGSPDFKKWVNLLLSDCVNNNALLQKLIMWDDYYEATLKERGRGVIIGELPDFWRRSKHNSFKEEGSHYTSTEGSSHTDL